MNLGLRKVRLYPWIVPGNKDIKSKGLYDITPLILNSIYNHELE